MSICFPGTPPTAAPSTATSSLLRQLYVNRETVIRNSNQATNGRAPYTPYGDVAPSESYHGGDFMLPYNGYDAYPATGRDNLSMMTPVPTLPSMQRHPYELPLRPQVLVHPSLDYSPIQEPQLYHHLSGSELEIVYRSEFSDK